MLEDGAQAPWWARRPARLGFLLAVLAVVAWYGVPKIIANAFGGTRVSECQVRFPPTARSSLPDLELLADADGMYALVGHGTLDTYGLQDPGAAWSDSLPMKPTALTARDIVGAGFEMRWWSTAGDHLGASLFVFPDYHEAAAYVEDAASTRCRDNAMSVRISQLPFGRGLVWENPAGWLQADVLFARQGMVFRLDVVTPGSKGKLPSPANTTRLLRLPEDLACALKFAACTGSGG